MNPVSFALLSILVLVWAMLAVRIFLLGPRGRRTTVTLLPYQKGILYRKGFPVGDVGPGKHRVWAGTELIVHGDTRPITVNYEKLIVGLRDGLAALYGFSANVQVQDMRKAIYSARNYPEAPPTVLLRCARRYLSAASGRTLNAESVANQISEDARKRLETAGFNLISFRITHLATGTPQIHT